MDFPAPTSPFQCNPQTAARGSFLRIKSHQVTFLHKTLRWPPDSSRSKSRFVLGLQTPSGLAPACLCSNISHCSLLTVGAPDKLNNVHFFTSCSFLPSATRAYFSQPPCKFPYGHVCTTAIISHFQSYIVITDS